MLKEIEVRPVERSEEPRVRELLQAQHYLGAVPKIGETIWYVATWRLQWVALLCFAAAALKCAARDLWIGWSYRQQYSRLQLLANNTRFCILDEWHRPNLGSRVLSLCEQRLCRDWEAKFGHPILLLETFVNPQRHRGTLYLASNWTYIGDTRGYRRRHGGYSAQPETPKKVFVRSLHTQVRAILCQPDLAPPYVREKPKLMLSAADMRALPEFFKHIIDPRRGRGLRHPLHVVLAIIAAATLCGEQGYTQIAEWAENLSQEQRAWFRCRLSRGIREVPGYTVIRNVMLLVPPQELDRALQLFKAQEGSRDSAYAVDGKVMRGSTDEAGKQTHIVGVVGHDTGICYTQKN
jgi:hypothetical protein